MPARAEAKARTSQLEVFASELTVQRKGELRLSQPPFTVNVQVDGETIARAVNNAQQSSAARAFSPVPVY